MTDNNKERVGVYICHCGKNIAGNLDVEELQKSTSELESVVVSKDYPFCCSDPGQEMIKKDIEEKDLTKVVVAACSPLLHEETFQEVVESGGLNPYEFQQANIREHCSWVTEDEEEATEKAKRLVRAAVRRVREQKPLEGKSVEVTDRVLVVGGGIAGITASLEVAESGKEVWLVEKTPSIGGHMAQLDKTFPTLDCSSCILTPKMSDVSNSPNIELLTYSEVESVDGYPGNFEVKIRKKARGVDENACTSCNACAEACPISVPSEFDEGLRERSAIYTPFPQAVPSAYAIDWEECVECGSCVEACKERGADCIDLEAEEEILEEKFGSIIVATGYELLDPSELEGYNYDKHENIVTGIEIERMLDAGGPTGGEILLEDGSEPDSAAFILCAGSRDREYCEYCSQVCCMYSMKQASMLKEELDEDVKISIFYTDIRAAGKEFEEFYNNVRESEVEFIRGRPSDIYESDGSLVVRAEDTVLAEDVEEKFDMVVLANAIVPNSDAKELIKELGLSESEDGFLMEKHPKLAPVNTMTDTILLAGVCQGPKDIPDTVSQASGAAAEAISAIDKGRVMLEPYLAEIDEDICCGCKTCIEVCPYDAVEFDEEEEICSMEEALCKGCGACVSACPSAAASQRGFRDSQITSEIRGVLEEVEER